MLTVGSSDKARAELTGLLPRDSSNRLPFWTEAIMSSMSWSLRLMAKACIGRPAMDLCELSRRRPLSVMSRGMAGGMAMMMSGFGEFLCVPPSFSLFFPFQSSPLYSSHSMGTD